MDVYLSPRVKDFTLNQIKAKTNVTSILEIKVVAGAQLNQVHRGQVSTASVVS